MKHIVLIYEREINIFFLCVQFISFSKKRVPQPQFLGALVQYFTRTHQPNPLNGTTAHETIEELDQTKPFLFGSAIELIRETFPNHVGDMFEAYFYATAVVLASAINVCLMHPYLLSQLHLGMKMRVAMCSMIYRKSLRLSKNALGETTVGQVVNLLSNDVGRLDLAVIFLHFLWVGPLETIIVTYMMYTEVRSFIFHCVYSLLPINYYCFTR